MRPILFIVAFLIFVQGNPTKSAALQQNRAAPATAEVTPTLPQEELSYLQQHRESLEMVKWAVGGVFTLVAGGIVLLLLVAGVNFFLYNRRYDEDKAAFRAEVNNEVREKSESASKALVERHEQLMQEITSQYDAKLQALKESLTKSAESTERFLRSQIEQIHFEKLMEEIRADSGNGKHPYVLMNASRAIELSLTAEDGWMEQAKLIDLIGKALKSGATLTADTAAELNTQLESLPKEYSRDVRTLQELIAEARKR
jgi:hypothetical protein